jgi:hypothetical protein
MTPLTQSPAFILAALLRSKGVVVLPGSTGMWPCYIGSMPDGDNVPDECVSIRDMPGIKEGRDMASGLVLERFGVQIKVRATSTDYNGGWQQLDAIMLALDKVVSQSVQTDTSHFYTIPAITRGSPLPMGQEPITESTKRRWFFALNATFTCDPV